MSEFKVLGAPAIPSPSRSLGGAHCAVIRLQQTRKHTGGKESSRHKIVLSYNYERRVWLRPLRPMCVIISSISGHHGYTYICHNLFNIWTQPSCPSSAAVSLLPRCHAKPRDTSTCFIFAPHTRTFLFICDLVIHVAYAHGISSLSIG